MQKYFSLLGLLCCLVGFQINGQSQCLAQFNLWQDTSVNAQPSTYFGTNTSIGSNFNGMDTINYTYTWSWGDGTSTVAPFPVHVYATPGVYTICLYMNAISSSGCNDTLCISQTINKKRSMYSVTIINPFIVTNVNTELSSALSVYPNPVTSAIAIHGTYSGSLTCALYGVDGQMIKRASLSQHECMDMAELPSGMYTLLVTEPSGKVIPLKVMK